MGGGAQSKDPRAPRLYRAGLKFAIGFEQACIVLKIRWGKMCHAGKRRADLEVNMMKVQIVFVLCVGKESDQHIPKLFDNAVRNSSN